MDTLGCGAALIALLLRIASHPRGEAAPAIGMTAAVLLLSIAAVFCGVRGYRRDWPRWANGRAAFAVAVGLLLLVVAVLDLVSRAG